MIKSMEMHNSIKTYSSMLKFFIFVKIYFFFVKNAFFYISEIETRKKSKILPKDFSMG